MTSSLRQLAFAGAVVAAGTGAVSANTDQCISDLAADTNAAADRYTQAVEDYAQDLGLFQKITAQSIIRGVNLACEGVENMGHGDVGTCITAIFGAHNQTGGNFQQELEGLEQRWVEIRDHGTCKGPGIDI